MRKLRTHIVAGGILAVFVGCSDESKPQSITGEPPAPPAAAAGSGAPVGATSSMGVTPTPAGPRPPAAGPTTPSTPTTPSMPSTATMPPAAGGAMPSVDPKTPLGMLPAECKGFDVLGLKESPGGSVLPNKCAPFDGTLNNPYAIRCIDADPSWKTQYSGDELCILRPPVNLGTQIHIGPDSYADSGKFELAAGAEISNYFYVNAANTEPRYYFRTNWRMRPGGHHMLVSMLDQDSTDGWQNVGDMGSDFGGRGKSFGGSQRVSVDRPQGVLEIPPENAGIGQQLAAKQQFAFNLHSFNTGDKPNLREVWVNIWYLDDAAVTKPIQTFAATGSPADMSIGAGQSVKLEYRCAVSAESRIISLYGHYHAHNVRFGAWVTHGSGEKLSIYESFDWEDIPVYQFDSVSKNPVPNVANRMDGASSGTLAVAPGDSIHFECDINNDSDRALRFADEAITGEMCILFGTYTGGNPCTGVQRMR